MRLLPADLPEAWHLKLAMRRANPAAPTPGDAPPPRMGFLGGLWAAGCGLTEERAAAVLPVVGVGPLLLTWMVGLMGTMVSVPLAAESGLGPGLGGLLFLGVSLGSFLAGTALGQWAFRVNVNRPLGEAELEALSAWARTDLDREFLGLVSDLVRLKVPARDEATLRAALADLAVAVATLPDATFALADPGELRRQAAELEAGAAAETDRPTAESLARRAQAVLRQAEAAEKAGLVQRRTRAVRDEIQAHIASLRTGLAALQSDAGDVQGLAALAESARVVAHEAVSVASARAELEEAVAAWPATPAAEAAVLQVGRE